MDKVLNGAPFAFVYLDDILVASPSRELHAQHLQHVFKLLSDNGLVVNKQKYEVRVSTLDYFGHRVALKGIHSLPHRIDVITQFPTPTDKPQLQIF